MFHVNSAFKETQDMMEFYPSKGYTWKTAPDPSASAKKDKTTVNMAKSVLRAQETQAFRHWMDRAIESSSAKVIQARQAIDAPESEEIAKPTSIELSPTQTRGNIMLSKYCFMFVNSITQRILQEKGLERSWMKVVIVKRSLLNNKILLVNLLLSFKCLFNALNRSFISFWLRLFICGS